MQIPSDPDKLPPVDLIGYGERVLAEHLGADPARPLEILALDVLAVAPGERAVFGAALAAGGEVVVKVDVDRDRLAKEARALRAAASVGVPVPAVLAVSAAAASPAAVLLLARVGGQPLTPSSPDRCWRAVGTQLRRLHDRVPVDGWPPFLPGAQHGWWARFRRWAADECRQATVDGQLPGTVVGLLRGRMSVAFDRASDPALRLLHGDCAPYHWLLNGDAVTAVLDFGDAGLGDPVWDLVVLTHWDEQRLPAVLDGYRASTALRAHVTETSDGYRIIRHLAARSWLVEHGFDAAPTLVELVRLARTDPRSGRTPRRPPG